MKFRKPILFIVIPGTILCISLYFVIIYNRTAEENYYRIQIDGWKGEKFCLEQGEDTRYSSDYTHKNFSKIKIGMKEEEVIDLLGEPLTRFSYAPEFDLEQFKKGHFVGLKYSDSPTSNNYRLRIVHLDYGVVVRVMGEAYND